MQRRSVGCRDQAISEGGVHAGVSRAELVPGAPAVSATTPEGLHGAGLRGWLDTLEAEGTRYQYSRLVEVVLAAGGGRLTAEGFAAHRDAEYERGLSLSSIGVMTAAVRGFARYLTDRALMSRAELHAFWEVPRLLDRPPAPVEVNDGFVGRMAAAAERTGYGSTLRVLTDRAVLVLLSGCGLRAGEAVAVLWSDYDSGAPGSRGRGATINVHRPSGIVLPRTLAVSAKGTRVLDELRELHRGLVVGRIHEVPILAGLWDSGSAAGLVRPFRDPPVQMAERTVDRLAQGAGAPEGAVRPSQLRDAYEARLQRAGLDAEEIAHRLGNDVVGAST